jgi:hypothetical protein
MTDHAFMEIPCWSVYWSYITHRLEFVFALLLFARHVRTCLYSKGTSLSAKLSICMYAAPSTSEFSTGAMPCVGTLERPNKI